MRLSGIALTLALCLAAPAQNPNPELLTNPSFEGGFSGGWALFNNAFLEMANPPQFAPATGNFLVSLFGQFGGVGVQTESGVFLPFPVTPGEVYEMSAKGRHWSGDALTGGGSATNSNFVLMRIAFFDASQNEVPNSGQSGLLLDGTFATDVWHEAAPIKARAPVGALTAQVLVIFIQPGLDPGAAHVDDISLKRGYTFDATTDPITSNTTLALSLGTPFTLFGNFFSFDPQNGTMPGMGPSAGLFIDQIDFVNQLGLVFNSVPPFGGLLDGNGSFSFVIPGSVTANLSGLTLYAVSLQLQANGAIDASVVLPIAF